MEDRAVDRVRGFIQQRIQEIEPELRQLRSALAKLTSDSSFKRSPRKASGRRRRAKRAPRGQRANQLIASIHKNPNYRAADHAKAIGVSPNQVYALASRLQKEGTIAKGSTGTYKVKRSPAKRQ